MQVFSVKIRTVEKSISSAPFDLTNKPVSEVYMAKANLPTNSCTINLSRGKVAIIDLEDFERVSQFKWSAQLVKTKSGELFYGFRTVWLDKQSVPKPRQLRILLHRFILNAPTGSVVDHINRDPLDCRRSNMRIGTQAQNIVNRDMRTGPSGYKGVSIRPWGYVALIVHQYKRINLGVFRTAVEAARAWDEAAKRLRGDIAILNFPDIENHP